jgi:hypothetical protein
MTIEFDISIHFMISSITNRIDENYSQISWLHNATNVSKRNNVSVTRIMS